MDLLKRTKEICKKYNIKPTRKKGQNFLVNSHIYEQIVKIADIGKEDCVLEVGPGLGFLTFELSKSARCVVSVELDDSLAFALREKIKDEKVDNIEVINQDILKLDIDEAIKNDFKLVANIPYNITSVLLRKICAMQNLPKSLTLLVQKEVAQRMIANSGDMNMLAISTQFYFNIAIKILVKPSNFWPQPRVDSSVLHMKLRDDIPDINAEDFFSFAKAGFGSKRKMLKNNLLKKYDRSSEEIFFVFSKLGLKNKIRAQELSLVQWVDLYREFNIK